MLNEGTREDYFDDLAEEITFYENLCIQKNCPSDHKITDAADPEQGVRQRTSSVNGQEAPLSAEKTDRDKPLLISEVIPDITSPKAKLRCCESTPPPTRKPVSSKDWLQEFTQDFVWMENNERPVTKTLQDTLDSSLEEQIDETAHLGRLQSAFQVCYTAGMY